MYIHVYVFMNNIIMKNTPTDYPIINEIKNRWSPRAFAEEPVSEEDLMSLFEAARWAPSAMNEQPWRFIYARKGEESFDQIAGALFEGNAWAKEAPVLIVSLARTTYTRNEKDNGSALYDLGQAVANLSIQATSLGLSLHQMGGIDKEMLQKTFEIPDNYKVMTIIALGKIGDPSELSEGLQQREAAERKRHTIDQFAFNGSFKIENYENAIA